MIEYVDISDNNVAVTSVGQSDSSIFFDEFPHIHIHTIISDWEILRTKRAISELCCHACKVSIFIIYTLDLLEKYPNGVPSVERIRDEWTSVHKYCADLPIILNGKDVSIDSFKIHCPTERIKTSTLDLSNL